MTGARHAVDLVLASVRKERPSARPEAPDRALIEACRRGDRDALDTVFRTHAPALERLLVRLVGPTADAEDLLQETFSAAITAFPNFRGEAAVGTWLYRIAVNVAQHHLRAPRRRDRSLGEEPVLSEQVLADAAIAHRELVDRVYVQLGGLEVKQRLALVLHVLEDLPIADVAALMGASRAATKSRIFWARRKLLRALAADRALDSGGEP